MKRSFKQKLLDIETLRNLPRPIVFTNGCFDILHAGHIDYLEKASQYGKTLVVGVNSDQSVKSLNKSPDRPFNSENQRAIVLAALESIDAIIVFDESTPLDLITAIKPDVLIKGGDWKVEDIVGGEFVQNNGGKVISIDFNYPTSTTKLVEKIQSAKS